MQGAEPFLIIFAAIVVITLITLTMRSIIKRDKAMIRENMDQEHKIAAYNERWRNQRGPEAD